MVLESILEAISQKGNLTFIQNDPLREVQKSDFSIVIPVTWGDNQIGRCKVPIGITKTPLDDTGNEYVFNHIQTYNYLVARGVNGLVVTSGGSVGPQEHT